MQGVLKLDVLADFRNDVIEQEDVREVILKLEEFGFLRRGREFRWQRSPILLKGLVKAHSSGDCFNSPS